MNSIELNKLYEDCYTSLKQTSYDKHNNTYMTNVEANVINFDCVKEKFASLLHINYPSSVDALYKENNTYYLIEFKNTEVNSINLHKKLYDSVIILSYIHNCSVSEIQKNCVYIVVYRNEKNKYINLKTDVENSKQYDKIKNFNSHIISFDLAVYKGYLCKNVYTYTCEEFKSKFIDKYFSIL